MYKLIKKPHRLLLVFIAIIIVSPLHKAKAETINWVNVPIGEFVIPRYESISGKRLMVDGSVAGSSITINSQIDMEPAEAIEFIKGSHLWDSYWKSYAPGSDALVNKSHKDLPDIDSLRSSHEFFSPEMQPGDALIFNAHIVHGSSSNLSLDKPRRAFTSRWCDDQTVFEDRIKTKPITANHNLKNGDFLSGPLFPQVRPNVIESELSLRNRGPIKLSKSKFLKDRIFKDFAGFFSFKNLINLR